MLRTLFHFVCVCVFSCSSEFFLLCVVATFSSTEHKFNFDTFEIFLPFFSARDLPTFFSLGVYYWNTKLSNWVTNKEAITSSSISLSRVCTKISCVIDCSSLHRKNSLLLIVKCFIIKNWHIPCFCFNLEIERLDKKALKNSIDCTGASNLNFWRDQNIGVQRKTSVLYFTTSCVWDICVEYKLQEDVEHTHFTDKRKSNDERASTDDNKERKY